MNRWKSWIVTAVTASICLTATALQAQEEPPEEVDPQEEEVAPEQPEPDEPDVEEPEDPIVEVGQDRASFGGFLGFDFDEIDDPFLGADARFFYNLPEVVEGFSLVANPTFNFYLSEGTLLQFDGNALARLDLDAPLTPYGGIGLAITFWDVAGESDLSLTFNPLIVGAEFNVTETIGGFAQFRSTRHRIGEPGFRVSFTTMALMGGINFGI